MYAPPACRPPLAILRFGRTAESAAAPSAALFAPVVLVRRAGRIHTCHLHMCIHIYVHTYIHVYVHTYIHIYIHTYTHVCVFSGHEMGKLKEMGKHVHQFYACATHSVDREDPAMDFGKGLIVSSYILIEPYRAYRHWQSSCSFALVSRGCDYGASSLLYSNPFDLRRP